MYFISSSFVPFFCIFDDLLNPIYAAHMLLAAEHHLEHDGTIKDHTLKLTLLPELRSHWLPINF